ncbi:MAG: hypothetical protein JJU22_14455 [Gammaproteobacteria bacterium]|nr:hypothetical protein [Gammaproteobacteria bacterium]
MLVYGSLRTVLASDDDIDTTFTKAAQQSRLQFQSAVDEFTRGALDLDMEIDFGVVIEAGSDYLMPAELCGHLVETGSLVFPCQPHARPVIIQCTPAGVLNAAGCEPHERWRSTFQIQERAKAAIPAGGRLQPITPAPS